MNSASPESPVKVPPFKPKRKPDPIEPFCWYSWHPNYPYWSESCWRAETEAKAHELFKSPSCAGLDVYHNKLIRQNSDGTLTEVADVPCERMDVWRRCLETQKRFSACPK